MLEKIFEANRKWVASKRLQDPGFFDRHAKGQQPRYLFIGCSDSRIDASAITGTQPGEMFIHRNIANLVVHTDINLLSVLQYAVDVLKVKDVIVCGHYHCGGVKAAMTKDSYGLIDNWLRNIKDVIRIHFEELSIINDEEEKYKRLVELNVIEQVNNLGRTSIIQDAWSRGQELDIHGLVYDIQEGLLRELPVDISKLKTNGEFYNI